MKVQENSFVWIRGGGNLGQCCLVCAASLSESLRNPIFSLDSVANYRPHISHFWAHVIFTPSTKSLSNYASTLESLKGLYSRSSLNEFIDKFVKLNVEHFNFT